MTSSKYCMKTRYKIQLSNSKKSENEQEHDLFLSKLTSALRCESFDRLPLNSSLGRLPLSEIAQELKTGKLISKFEDFDCYKDGEDESPYVYTCSFVLAIMYFERLKVSNPSYLKSISSSELFLISLLVASKYLHDDGELDSAINSEWAEAYGISLKRINRMEKNYLSAMNWEFYISDEEFTIRHKQIVAKLYTDSTKSSSVLLKIFLLISSVVQSIRKLYQRKALRQKLKQMIAVSTMITVVSATTMQFIMDSDNQKMIQEVYNLVASSDSNYSMIPSTTAHTNQTESLNSPKNMSEKWHFSKLALLVDEFLLMYKCTLDDRRSSYQTILGNPTRNKCQNFTFSKSPILLNHFTSANCTF